MVKCLCLDRLHLSAKGFLFKKKTLLSGSCSSVEFNGENFTLMLRSTVCKGGCLSGQEDIQHGEKKNNRCEHSNRRLVLWEMLLSSLSRVE